MKSDITALKRYSKEVTKKAELETQLKAVKAKIDELTKPVIDYFQRQGMSAISVGERTLYMRREVHTSKAPAVTQEEACNLLREIGHDEYAGQRVNTQGLSAWVREQEEGGEMLEDIEAGFKGLFRVVEVFKIGQRKK